MPREYRSQIAEKHMFIGECAYGSKDMEIPMQGNAEIRSFPCSGLCRSEFEPVFYNIYFILKYA